MSSLITAGVPAVDAGNYLHWGVISISVTNAIIIGLMVLVFVLAIVIPFPRGSHSEDDSTRGGS